MAIQYNPLNEGYYDDTTGMPARDPSMDGYYINGGFTKTPLPAYGVNGSLAYTYGGKTYKIPIGAYGSNAIEIGGNKGVRYDGLTGVNDVDGNLVGFSGTPTFSVIEDWNQALRNAQGGGGLMESLGDIAGPAILAYMGAQALGAAGIGDSIGADLGANADLAFSDGASLGTSMPNADIGGALSSSGSFGSGITGSIDGLGTAGRVSSGADGLYTVGKVNGVNMLPSSVSSMGGGQGLVGTVDGVGSLSNAGILTPAAGGAVSSLSGAKVGGGLTTSLANDPIGSIPSSGSSGLSLKNVSDALRAASLLGGGTPVQSSGGLLGGGYSANIQPDNSLLSIQKPQFASIFSAGTSPAIYNWGK